MTHRFRRRLQQRGVSRADASLAVGRNLRIVRVSGEAMEPALRAGDRLVVDTARRLPRAGALFVFRLSGGFEFSRVERIDGTDPPTLRLSCAHPDYPDRTCLAEEIDILGEGIWKMIRRSAWPNRHAWNFRCTPDRIATPVQASLPSADLRRSLPSGLRSKACARSRATPPKFARNGRKNARRTVFGDACGG